MSAYLKFFELEKSPFEGTDQSKVVLGTQALREAFATIQSGLDEGASRVFINGGPGVGKTSFARAMPKLLGDETLVAGIADPSLPWDSLRGGIAMQWGLDTRGLARASLLAAAEDHRLLLVIDQAELATEDFLDHLDVLLSYRDEFADPVVQSVLLGQLSGAATGDSAPPLLWWLDRIQTLQLEYAPLPREGVGPYIRKHLKRAGWRGGRLFTDEAALAIHGWTGGIPGEVSRLCERLLVEAAECGVEMIDPDFVDLYHEDEYEPEADFDLEMADDDETEEPWNFDHEFDEFEASKREDPDQNRPRLQPKLEPEDAELERAAREERLASQKAALPVSPTGTRRDAALPRLETTLDHFETLELLDETGTRSTHEKPDTPIHDEEKIEEASYLDQEEGFDPEAETASETYAELEALEQALSAPPSPAELREIRGSFLQQNAKTLTIAAVAAVIGGLAFALLFQGPTVDDAPGRIAGTASMLGRVNGPADGMPPEPPPVVRLQNTRPVEAERDLPRRNPRTAASPSDELLARVGPRLKKASEQDSARRAAATSGRTRIQKELETEDRKEIFQDLRPESLTAEGLDLSENRNR